MPDSAQTMYEKDFVRWLDEQACALRNADRSGANLPIDWQNLAEEVETLGRSERRELRSRLSTVLAHLLKMQISPASEPVSGWKSTIDRERHEIIYGLIEDSPSLEREVAALIPKLLDRAKDGVRRDLITRGELTSAADSTLDALSYSKEQVLGDWFPDESR